MYNIERKLRLKARLDGLYETVSSNFEAQGIYNKYDYLLKSGYSNSEIVEGLITDLSKYSKIIPELDHQVKSLADDLNENFAQYVCLYTYNGLKRSDDPSARKAADIFEKLLAEDDHKIYKKINEGVLDLYAFVPEVSSSIARIRNFYQEKPVLENVEFSTPVSPIYELSTKELVFNSNGTNFLLNLETRAIVEYKGDIVDESSFRELQTAIHMFDNGGNVSMFTNKHRFQITKNSLNETVLSVDGKILDKNLSEFREYMNYMTVSEGVNTDEVNLFIHLFENFDSVVGLDFATTISNKNIKNRKVVLFNSKPLQKVQFVDEREGKTWVYESKNPAELVEDVKQFLECDITPWVEGTVEQKEREKNELSEKVKTISSDINFLKENIKTLQNHKNWAVDPKLKSAAIFLMEELSKKEDQKFNILEDLHESLTKQMEELGYSPAKLSKPFNELRKGDLIYVNAMQYSTAGESELIDSYTESKKEVQIPKLYIEVTF